MWREPRSKLTLGVNPQKYVIPTPLYNTIPAFKLSTPARCQRKMAAMWIDFTLVSSLLQVFYVEDNQRNSECEVSFWTIIKMCFDGCTLRSSRYPTEGEKGRSESGCHGEKCVESHCEGTKKETELSFGGWHWALCPHRQVMNGVGLPAHLGRAMISHQPPSSAQQVTGVTLLIDLSGQWLYEPQTLCWRNTGWIGW